MGIGCYTELLISLFNWCHNKCFSHICGSFENIMVIRLLTGPWRQRQNILLKEVSVRLKNKSLNDAFKFGDARKNFNLLTCSALTYYMEQGPSWEANQFSASQEIPHILWNLKVHYCIHKCVPPVSILSFVYKHIVTRCLYGEELLAPRPTPKPEDHPFLAVRICLFNIFAATLCIGGRSSIHHLRTCQAVVTGTHLSCTCNNLEHIMRLTENTQWK